MRSSQLDNANTRSRPPSEVIAHYLEAIYYIRAEGEAVRSARLADWLSVSRPTVTVALRRMTRDGMVRLNAHKEIELTVRGDEAAAAIVRRHRIPIPGHSTMRANELRLSALGPGESGTITRISEVAQREAPPLLQYLHDRGLHPGTRITVEEVDEIGGTMRLRAARQLTLSYQTASKLSVVRSARRKP